VYRGNSTEALRNAVHEVASAAMAHLNTARGMRERIAAKISSRDAATARAVLLPAVGTGAYLDALEKRDFDVFDPGLIRGTMPLVTQARIGWNAYRGTY
jgi:NADH dehydrogenase [ubiquinone] 1 alpha subcomplex assembly factor 6